MHSEELVYVVDKDDNILRTIQRKDAKPSDILRVVGIFITHKNGEILLQLRSEKSYRYPSYWDCTGGGHVDVGEDYLTAAQRELLEEVGIDTELQFLGKHYYELDDGRKHIIAFFKGEYSGETTIDPKEVTKVKPFSQDEIKKMIEKDEHIHPECLFGLQKYFF